jgi:hypothetical protein
MSIRISAFNRGPDSATLHILPNLWFRNTWSWDPKHTQKPSLRQSGSNSIQVEHVELGVLHFYAAPSPPPANAEGDMGDQDDPIEPQLIFAENETNYGKLWGGQNKCPYVKDAFHNYVIPSHRPSSSGGKSSTDEDDPGTPRLSNSRFINPNQIGTKAAAYYLFRDVPPNGGCVVIRLKLTSSRPEDDPTLQDDEAFDTNMDAMREDADEFFRRLSQGPISDDLRSVMRQALAGMMWSKQFYQFIQTDWINGDPGQPPPPPERKWIRNRVILLLLFVR